MKENFPGEDRERLDALIKARDLDYSAVSKAIGRNHSYIFQFMKRGNPKKLPEDARAALAKFFGVQESTFRPGPAPIPELTPTAPADQKPPVDLPPLLSMPQDVPVLGVAAGSLSGAFQIEDGPIDFVRRPPGLAGAQGVYAIYVRGDSNSPAHEDGDLRFVHPHRPVHVGDWVVLQTKHRPDEPPQSYIKRLVRRIDGKIIVEQLNPKARIEFKAKYVIAVHKVLSMNELFGI